MFSSLHASLVHISLLSLSASPHSCIPVYTHLKFIYAALLDQERQEEAGRPWRVESGSLPLIFAGGPTATSNPEPFADFFDYFLLGDGVHSPSSSGFFSGGMGDTNTIRACKSIEA